MNSIVRPTVKHANAPDHQSASGNKVIASSPKAAQCELFLVCGDTEFTVALQAALPATCGRFTCFDLAEPFLIHMMRHPVQPGVLRFVLIHADLTGMSGLETLVQLQKLEPSTSVILLADTTTPCTVIDAWHNGAIDFILAPYTAQSVLQAVRRSVESRPQQASRYARSDVDACLKNYQTLTRREREILHLVAQGKRSHQIAEEIFISMATVKMHRANLMRKLGLSNAAQMAAFYHKCSSDIN